MSRKLNFLFAVRVLGHDPKVEAALAMGSRDYVSSLDAAWQGVEKLQKAHSWRLLVIGGDEAMPFWRAELFGHRDAAKDYGQRHGTANASHPALAIVLACLRAVGVTKDEIEEAKDGKV